MPQPPMETATATAMAVHPTPPDTGKTIPMPGPLKKSPSAASPTQKPMLSCTWKHQQPATKPTICSNTLSPQNSTSSTDASTAALKTPSSMQMHGWKTIPSAPALLPTHPHGKTKGNICIAPSITTTMASCAKTTTSLYIQ